MTNEDFEAAKLLDADIDTITACQAKIALAGSRVHLMVTDANKTVVHLPEDKLKAILGDSSYNTICSTALTSLSSALSSLKTTKQNAFTALGEE